MHRTASMPASMHEASKTVSVEQRVDDHGLAPAAATATGGVGRPLEMFFPFDPYLLKRSSRFLALPSCYTTWRQAMSLAGAASTSHAEGDEDSDAEEGGGRGGEASTSDSEDDTFEPRSASMGGTPASINSGLGQSYGSPLHPHMMNKVGAAWVG